jgi:hypothetical protein
VADAEAQRAASDADARRADARVSPQHRSVFRLSSDASSASSWGGSWISVCWSRRLTRLRAPNVPTPPPPGPLLTRPTQLRASRRKRGSGARSSGARKPPCWRRCERRCTDAGSFAAAAWAQSQTPNLPADEG